MTTKTTIASRTVHLQFIVVKSLVQRSSIASKASNIDNRWQKNHAKFYIHSNQIVLETDGIRHLAPNRNQNIEDDIGPT